MRPEASRQVENWDCHSDQVFRSGQNQKQSSQPCQDHQDAGRNLYFVKSELGYRHSTAPNK
jgi:hypothetical protein